MTQSEMDDWIAEVKAREVEIDMSHGGGMGKLKFRPGTSTGPAGSETDYSIGFDFVMDKPPRQFRDGTYIGGMGVMRRCDARRLRDMLVKFFDEYDSEQAASLSRLMRTEGVEVRRPSQLYAIEGGNDFGGCSD